MPDHYKTDLLDLRRMDCMDLMREYPDKHFDLAIVDPPYGIYVGDNKAGMGRRKGDARATYKMGDWDSSPPPQEYFSELRRVSTNQIVWGANHFVDRIPLASPCWIVWDKLNSECDFADCELAWTSFRSAVRRFSFRWAGMLQGDMANKEIRIHPTQKPVALYRWILSKYSQPGQRILDTHLGSGSIAIACHYFGVHLTGSELDQDYFNAMCERIQRETRQTTLEL